MKLTKKEKLLIIEAIQMLIDDYSQTTEYDKQRLKHDREKELLKIIEKLGVTK